MAQFLRRGLLLLDRYCADQQWLGQVVETSFLEVGPCALQQGGSFPCSNPYCWISVSAHLRLVQ